MNQALISLLLFLCFSNILIAQEEAFAHPLQGKEAPAFKVTSLQDVEFDLVKLRGKVVVLNFWATWCKPCRAEFKSLNKLAEKYKGLDVVFLSICSENKEEVMALLKKKKLNTTIVPSSRQVLQLYQVRMLPTNMVIDKEGKITGVLTGYNPEVGEAIGNLVESGLKK